MCVSHAWCMYVPTTHQYTSFHRLPSLSCPPCFLYHPYITHPTIRRIFSFTSICTCICVGVLLCMFSFVCFSCTQRCHIFWRNLSRWLIFRQAAVCTCIYVLCVHVCLCSTLCVSAVCKDASSFGVTCQDGSSFDRQLCVHVSMCCVCTCAYVLRCVFQLYAKMPHLLA